MNPFGLAGLLTGITSLAVGVFVLSKEPTQKLNRVWFAFTCSVAAWGFGALWISLEKNPSVALTAWRLAYAFGVVWIPVLFYHFVLIFSERRQDPLLLLQYTLGMIFSFVALFSPGIFARVRFVFSSFYYGMPGILYPVYFIWWVGLVFYAHYQIYKDYRGASSVRRNQLKYILLAFVLAYSTGSLAYLPNWGVDIYPYGTFGIMLYPIIVTYAIVSYHLMDIQTVVHKTAAWATISSLVAVPTLGIFYFGHQWTERFSPMGPSLLVASTGLLLIPYVKWVLPHVDHFFQRRKYDLETVSQEFIRDISVLKTPTDLISAFQSTLSTVLYPEKISLILFDIRSEEIKATQCLALDPAFLITPHLSLLKWLEANNVVVDRERVVLDPRYRPVKDAASAYLSATDAAVVVPLVHNQRLFCVINLAQKRNLQPYTSDEIGFLSNLKIEGSIALSNALLYADVHEMSESLRKWANELESRVEDRTHELEESYEKLKEMDRLKSRFFSNISHELRTPLTLLIGPTNTLLSKQLGAITKEQEEYLTVIHSHSTRLLRLINALLDLAKVDAGEATLFLERGDFIAFVKKTVNSVLPLAVSKALSLSVEANEKIPVFLYDHGKMEDVLLNLLSNALKFTEKGGIRVSCSQQWNNVLVKVSDTGIGIPQDAIPKLFDRFFQVETAASRVVAGTGIGLSLVKEWVELHRGRVWVESEEGRGTAFFFTIPIRIEEVVEAPGTAPRRAPLATSFSLLQAQVGLNASEGTETWGRAPFRGDIEQILLVDDNADMLRFMADQLKDSYNLLFARDGNEGILLARAERPDLIISDIMMPIKDGYQLCRELKGDPQTSNIPIIFLTAKGALSDKIEGLEQGADDYLTKPFSREELLTRTHSLIKKARLQKEVLLKNKQLEDALKEVKRVGRDLMQSEKMASLGLLLAGVAHELNNPINFAKGSLLLASNRFGRLTQLDVADPQKFSEVRRDVMESLDVVKSGLTRVEGVLKNLSAFIRKDEDSFDSLDLHASLDLVWGLLRYECLEGVEVYRDYKGTLQVEAVPGQINQSFLNIFQNALDAMGGCTDRKLFIGTRVMGDTAVVSIRDTGAGIPESDTARLFEPFFTTKTVGKGTGLGLSLVYKMIVETHHGAIDVKSQVGQGTEFIITLPLKQPRSAPQPTVN